MKKELRILTGLLNTIKKDLSRPHKFSYERVGFVHCRAELNGAILLAESYVTIGDEKYIPDDFVGARFSGSVIEQELVYALKTGQSVFHIHQHEHLGEPMLSGVDTKSIGEICASLASINNNVPHGCILLSEDVVKVYVFSPKHNRLVHADSVVVGFPLVYNSYKEVEYEK